MSQTGVHYMTQTQRFFINTLRCKQPSLKIKYAINFRDFRNIELKAKLSPIRSPTTQIQIDLQILDQDRQPLYVINKTAKYAPTLIMNLSKSSQTMIALINNLNTHTENTDDTLPIAVVIRFKCNTTSTKTTEPVLVKNWQPSEAQIEEYRKRLPPAKLREMQQKEAQMQKTGECFLNPISTVDQQIADILTTIHRRSKTGRLPASMNHIIKKKQVTIDENRNQTWIIPRLQQYKRQHLNL